MFWLFCSILGVEIYTRLGLLCRTPLRFYPSLIPTPCSLSPYLTLVKVWCEFWVDVVLYEKVDEVLYQRVDVVIPRWYCTKGRRGIVLKGRHVIVLKCRCGIV